MTNTPRANNIAAMQKFPEAGIEESKMMYISSAWLKTCDLYPRFLSYYNSMRSSKKGYFVASLDYQVGIDAGLWTKEKMEEKKNDPNVTWDSWLYEYSNAPYIRNYIMKIQQIFEKKGDKYMWTKEEFNILKENYSSI